MAKYPDYGNTPKKKTPVKKAPVKKPVVTPDTTAVGPIVTATPEQLTGASASTDQLTGVGDVIKFVTNAVGVEQCEQCKERQAKLNRLFPFTLIAKEMTGEEIEFIKRIKNNMSIGYVDRNYLFEKYNRILNQHLVPCQCPSIVIQIREKLWQIFLANHSTNISEE